MITTPWSMSTLAPTNLPCSTCTVHRYIRRRRTKGRKCEQVVSNTETPCGQSGCGDLHFKYQDSRDLCDKHKEYREREWKRESKHVRDCRAERQRRRTVVRSLTT